MLRVKFVNSGQATKAIVSTCRGCLKPLLRGESRGSMCPKCVKNNVAAAPRR